MAMRSEQQGRRERETQIKRLYEVCSRGSLSSLLQLIEEDELIFDRVMTTDFNETPLHIAAMVGHLEVAREILKRKPELATELNSESSSPLHLASAKGNLEMVKELLNINPSACWVTDRNGRTPLHLATIKGRIDVMKELLQSQPEVIHVRVERGETVLHLCVKNSRLEALRLLLESAASDQRKLLNSKDDDGNTVLHLATAMKQTEVIKLLVDKNEVEINEMNSFGLTALDILAQSPPPRDTKDMDIGDSLRAAGALKADEIISSAAMPITRSSRRRRSRNSSRREMRMLSVYPEEGDYWLASQKNSLMVVSTVIAAMAFQAILSPPKIVDASPPAPNIDHISRFDYARPTSHVLLRKVFSHQHSVFRWVFGHNPFAGKWIFDEEKIVCVDIDDKYVDHNHGNL